VVGDWGEAALDATGKLTEEERASIVAFVNSKTKSPNDGCLVCGDPDTRVGSHMLGLPTGTPQDWGAQQQPVVPIICHNCGFVRYFHAESLGLVSLTISPEGE
jgi:hypothetical protein